MSLQVIDLGSPGLKRKMFFRDVQESRSLIQLTKPGMAIGLIDAEVRAAEDKRATKLALPKAVTCHLAAPYHLDIALFNQPLHHALIGCKGGMMNGLQYRAILLVPGGRAQVQLG